MPRAAVATMVPRSSTERGLKRRVVTSAIAAMKRGYTPAARSMVPPLMPGTRLASPISVPPMAPRRTSRDFESCATGASDSLNDFSTGN